MGHEPLAFINLLRGQLTAKDKRIVFLFGAGSSSAVNVAPPARVGERRDYEALIPAVRKLTEMCSEAVRDLGSETGRCWDEVVQRCVDSDQEPHIENILSLIRLNIGANPSGGGLGLSSEDLQRVHVRILETISKVTNPAEDRIPDHLPHDDFAHWVRGATRKFPVEAFTTNYDILLERSLELARVPVFDGFVGSHRPFFMPQFAANASPWLDSRWVGLWKLHGSVNWGDVGGATVRVQRPESGSMIYPSHLKYDESRRMPYAALISRLSAVMSANSTVLVTVGYSWNDQHINSSIIESIEANPKNSVIALMYEELSSVPHLVQLAKRNTNLLVSGPRSAVLGGLESAWRLSGPATAIKATLLDRWFDTDALVPDADEPGVRGGAMRLGDFNHFARFLSGLNVDLQVGAV